MGGHHSFFPWRELEGRVLGCLAGPWGREASRATSTPKARPTFFILCIVMGIIQPAPGGPGLDQPLLASPPRAGSKSSYHQGSIGSTSSPSAEAATAAGKPRPGEAGSRPSKERRQAWPGTPRNGGGGGMGVSLLGQPPEPSENRKFQPRAPPRMGQVEARPDPEKPDRGGHLPTHKYPGARPAGRGSQEGEQGRHILLSLNGISPGQDEVSVLCLTRFCSKEMRQSQLYSTRPEGS